MIFYDVKSLSEFTSSKFQDLNLKTTPNWSLFSKQKCTSPLNASSQLICSKKYRRTSILNVNLNQNASKTVFFFLKTSEYRCNCFHLTWMRRMDFRTKRNCSDDGRLHIMPLIWKLTQYWPQNSKNPQIGLFILKKCDDTINIMH